MMRTRLLMLMLAVAFATVALFAACDSGGGGDDDDDDHGDDDDVDDDDDVEDDDEGCVEADQDNLGVDPGKTMADWTLYDYLDEDVSLYDDYCGLITVIMVGAGWCPACAQEANNLQTIKDEYVDEGVDIAVILGENYSEGGTPTPDFLESYKNYHDLVDVRVLGDPGYSVSAKYFLQGYIPLNIFLTRDMEIAYVFEGYSYGMIDGKIKRMLNEEE